MTAREKQETLSRLQTVIPLFQQFEQAYSAAKTLPQLRRELYGQIGILQPFVSFMNFSSELKPLTDTVEPLRKAMGKANDFADSAMTATVSTIITVVSFAILFIPSVILACFVSTPIILITRLTDTAWIINLLLGVVIDVLLTKSLSRFIRKKIKQAEGALDKQVVLLNQQCENVSRQISCLDMSWYPPDYCYSDAAKFFYKAINNGMCGTLGEAAALYEQKLFQDKVLANQQELINIAYEQCVLQRQTLEAVVAQGEAARQAIHDEGARSREQRFQIYKDLRRRTGI